MRLATAVSLLIFLPMPVVARALQGSFVTPDSPVTSAPLVTPDSPVTSAPATPAEDAAGAPDFIFKHVSDDKWKPPVEMLIEARQIYDSACEVVKREFNLPMTPRPRFIVILGTKGENKIGHDERILKLEKWNIYYFADAVDIMAVDQTMLTEARRREMAKRAVAWATAKIDVHALTDK